MGELANPEVQGPSPSRDYGVNPGKNLGCNPPSLPLPFAPPFPSLQLEVGPLNTARGLWSTVSSPNGLWGRAQAKIELRAFWP